MVCLSPLAFFGWTSTFPPKAETVLVSMENTIPALALTRAILARAKSNISSQIAGAGIRVDIGHNFRDGYILVILEGADY